MNNRIYEFGTISNIDRAFCGGAPNQAQDITGTGNLVGSATNGLSAVGSQAAMQQGNFARSVYQTTIADHIEQRMCRMKAEMDRLTKIKKQLSEPNGVLTVSMDDLQFAMRY